MTYKTRIWVSCIVASICQIIVWVQIWLPYFIGHQVNEEAGLPGARAIAVFIVYTLNLFFTILSPVVWFWVYFLLRYVVFRAGPVQTRHGVFLFVGILPMIVLCLVVFDWSY